MNPGSADDWVAQRAYPLAWQVARRLRFITLTCIETKTFSIFDDIFSWVIT